MSFYVGQKVVCVDAIYELMNGHTYIVTGLYNSCGCGACITVGLIDTAITSLDRIYLCVSCGSFVRATTNEWTIRANRFAPIDPLTETMDRIEAEGCPELEPVTL